MNQRWKQRKALVVFPRLHGLSRLFSPIKLPGNNEFSRLKAYLSQSILGTPFKHGSKIIYPWRMFLYLSDSCSSFFKCLHSVTCTLFFYLPPIFPNATELCINLSIPKPLSNIPIWMKGYLEKNSENEVILVEWIIIYMKTTTIVHI